VVPRRLSHQGWLTYEQFYGLKDKAFSLSSDPSFFYPSASHGSAFNELLSGIRRRESLSVLTGDIGAGKTNAAPQQLDELSNSGSKAVRASALFARAALALQQNDTKLATAKYRQIAADNGLPQSYRDAATIRQTALEFDSLKPEEVIARLQPLTKPGSPWFGSAGEMTAMALIKQNKKAEAGRLFAAMARDKQVPEELRARAVQIASTLGVDASSEVPLLAQ